MSAIPTREEREELRRKLNLRGTDWERACTILCASIPGLLDAIDTLEQRLSYALSNFDNASMRADDFEKQLRAIREERDTLGARLHEQDKVCGALEQRLAKRCKTCLGTGQELSDVCHCGAGMGDYHDNHSPVEMTSPCPDCTKSLEQRLSAAEADTARLNWLESRRLALNSYNGTDYGWKFSASHNVTRLFVRDVNTIDLNDAEPLRGNIRAAIDAARKEGKP